MGRTILVVDDEAELVASCERLLRRAGHVSLRAYTGPEAMALIDSDQPDLVVADLRLPKADGLAVARHARAQVPPIPVILITAYDSWQARQSARRSWSRSLSRQAVFQCGVSSGRPAGLAPQGGRRAWIGPSVRRVISMTPKGERRARSLLDDLRRPDAGEPLLDRVRGVRARHRARCQRAPSCRHDGVAGGGRARRAGGLSDLSSAGSPRPVRRATLSGRRCQNER